MIYKVYKKFAIDSSAWVSQFITFLSFPDMKIFQNLYIYTHILRTAINSRNNCATLVNLTSIIYWLIANHLHDVSQFNNIKDMFTYLKVYE